MLKVSKALLQKLGFKKLSKDGSYNDWKGEAWYHEDWMVHVFYDERDSSCNHINANKENLVDLIESIVAAIHEQHYD